jgi:hypothetical protein
MLRTRLWLVAVAVVFAFLFAEPAGEAALAKALGRPRYTARLSSNPAIRRQQLIVDPEDIAAGSVSLSYDPSVVHLADVLDPASFQVTGGFVSVRRFAAADTLIPLSIYLTGGGAAEERSIGEHEVGYVQIFFNQRAAAGLRGAAAGVSAIPNLPGYQTVDEDGPTGISDTHALIFDYLAPVASGLTADYSIFASPPLHGTVADSLTSLDSPTQTIPYTDIGGAFVSGSLLVAGGPSPQPVPLPAAAWSGSVLLIVLGIVWRRRGCRAATMTK